jgi:dTDP-4-amino-4,6-dideoxygalactose transaminase
LNFSNNFISFNKPYCKGSTLEYIDYTLLNASISGDGHFTAKCSEEIVNLSSAKKALLTHSCTASIEMSAILANIQRGDEIIMPSYTFVSTANAFVLRGGVPVFVDIEPTTFNIDPNLVEKAITSRTKAIVPVHYAGVGCEMKKIIEIAEKHKILVIEDAAQGIMSKYQDQPLGSFGDLGCISFHETKNIHCGEGGALLINNEKFIERAEIIRDKGTNRSQFFRGQVNKYRWIDIGSSYLPGELTAAFLFAQLEKAKEITADRLSIWYKYYEIFEDLEKSGLVRRPIIPESCKHNGHIFHLLLDKSFNRDSVLQQMNKLGVNAVFHYQPLHSSPAGKKYGKFTSDSLPITDDISGRIIRLPMWIGFDQHVRVKETLQSILK